MKGLIRNIFFLILISLGFSSCIHDSFTGVESDVIDPNKTILFLDLKALNPSTMTTPAEKIKSVRVIIIGNESNEEGIDADYTDNPGETPASKGIVECNRLYEFPIVNASNFSYTLTWESNLGKKSVYVIANEESVGGNLKTTLDQYKETEDAGNLEEWLQSYSFKPEYAATGNTIYLPYTYFKTDFMPQAGKVNPVNCWLVPVATKFVFIFHNKRDNRVRINGISMAYANSESYLMPSVDSEAQYMEYGSESLYWPDWLAAVSQASWDYPEFGGNEEFNRGTGWITDYYVPNSDNADIFTFIEKDSKEVFYIDAASEVTNDDGTTETVLGSHTTNIFYLPESINYKNPTVGSGEEQAVDDNTDDEQTQTFYLTLKIEDPEGGGTPPQFENLPIPNLNALFRNTFVVIEVTFVTGDIEIYAEIAPWNQKIAHGWVSEGNAPGNNPFSLKRK